MNTNLVKKLRLRFVQNCVVSEDEKEKNAWTLSLSTAKNFVLKETLKAMSSWSAFLLFISMLLAD